MPAPLILIYYFGVPAHFIYKRCGQLGGSVDSDVEIEKFGRQKFKKKYLFLADSLQHVEKLHLRRRWRN